MRAGTRTGMRATNNTHRPKTDEAKIERKQTLIKQNNNNTITARTRHLQNQKEGNQPPFSVQGLT